jgi:tetratricopeptide (TPR) repeat protein
LTDSTADTDSKLARAAARLDSDPAAAARVASEILAQQPGHAAASLLLATASRNIGHTEVALGVLQELARTQPTSAVVQLELGRAYRLAGQPAQALPPLQRAVQLEPNLADGWRELSTELAAAEDMNGADAAYARYAALTPESAQLAEAAAALAENRLAVAENLLVRYLRVSPRDPPALRLLAQVALRREDFAGAERLLHECLARVPGYSQARYDLACALLTQQKAASVLPLVERLLALDPANRAYRDLKARVLSLTGQQDQAIEIFAALLAEQPDHGPAWMNYGHELKAAGRVQETVAAYRRSIALAPRNGAAYWSLANLKTFRFEPSEVAAMRAALQRDNLGHDERVHFEFALGRALEDAALFSESAEHYAAANALRRTATPYEAAKLTAHVARAKKLYSQQFFAARSGWGSEADDPIFVVGLPRAGSTLLEQILASHSRVEGTRELDEIPAIARDLGNTHDNAGPAYPQSVGALEAVAVRALAERYLEETRVYRVGGRPRFIDKMPNNFLHVGLIHLLFPRAAIIDARRHPLGCAVSVFKQHFANGHAFAYDLMDIGRYYRDYVELMEHFDTVLPGRVHRVFYENVVADVRGETQRLLAYCGLPFEEQCLRFHENPRIVQTASSQQVRQPIFAESVRQWRRYEPWLGPLQETLGDIVAQYPVR